MSPSIALAARLRFLSLGWAAAPPSPDGFDKCRCRALTITHVNPSVASQAAAQTERGGSLSVRLQRGRPGSRLVPELDVERLSGSYKTKSRLLF